MCDPRWVDTLELAITNVAHGGVFVARHDGRVVFVADTMPGERVRARITDDAHASFWRAETVEVLEASLHRVPHIWSAASIDRDPENRAGGAEFGHIALEHQRELKSRVIADALERMAALRMPVAVEAVAGDDESGGTGWRTRVRLHVDDDGRVGPFAARSHRVIPVDDLPLATSALQAEAPLRERMPGVASIDVVAPSVGPVRVQVNTDDDRSAGKTGRGTRNARRARSARPAPRAAQTARERGAGQSRGGEAADRIHERVGGRQFALDVGGFWQVHRSAPVVLTAAVQQAIDEALFEPQAANLDLYGGVGLLAAAVGDRFGATTRITTVESNSRATDFAAENLAEWVGASAVTERTERYVARLVASAGAAERARLRAGTVVLDPPRSGAGKAVVGALGALRPAQVVYVACDPVAFARDAALLAAEGYGIRAIRAFDLFPGTHHVELVATLVPER